MGAHTKIGCTAKKDAKVISKVRKRAMKFFAAQLAQTLRQLHCALRHKNGAFCGTTDTQLVRGSPGSSPSLALLLLSIQILWSGL